MTNKRYSEKQLVAHPSMLLEVFGVWEFHNAT